MLRMQERGSDAGVHRIRRGRLLRIVEQVLATTSSGGKHTVVALGLRGGIVVAKGVNSYVKTHPMMCKMGGYPFLHAEIACLIKAPKDIDTLFVARRNKRGQWVNATPCPICERAISLFSSTLKVIST